MNQEEPTYLQCSQAIVSLSAIMAGQQYTGEILLRLLHLHDAFFERVADVEAYGCHFARLTDAMDAGEGLLFDSRVPIP